jgi:hypothetical protein
MNMGKENAEGSLTAGGGNIAERVVLGKVPERAPVMDADPTKKLVCEIPSCSDAAVVGATAAAGVGGGEEP